MSLRKFYHYYFVNAHNTTPLERIVDAYLNDAYIDGPLLDQAIAQNVAHDRKSLWDLIDIWQNVLPLLLIAHDRPDFTEHKRRLADLVAQLKNEDFFLELPLLSAYRQLADVLVGHPRLSTVVDIEHGSFGLLASPAYKAELGTIFWLLAALTNEQQFANSARHITDSQLTTLDHECLPFASLFARENETTYSTLLINNYILFHAASRIILSSDCAFVAQRLMSQIEKQDDSTAPLSLFPVILEKWFDDNTSMCSAKKFVLPISFHNKMLAIAGSRSKDRSALATMYGRRSGIGSYHFGDLKVLNIGPQHLPLDDCRGFGLEGGHDLLSDHIKHVWAEGGDFMVEGVARMASLPKKGVEGSSVLMDLGEPCGIWLDAKVSYSQGMMSIGVKLSRLNDHPMAFVFFVSSSSCLIGESEVVKPRSFQKYQGVARDVTLIGEGDQLVISPKEKIGEMQVIPLGGGDNFWGADFLISYSCPYDQEEYSWEIVP